MRIGDFIDSLALRGVTLWLDSDRLQYRAPKGSMTPELLEQIRTRKTTIIQHLRESGSALKTYPLSYTQQGVWSIERLAPGNSAYNVSAGLRLQGSLEPNILEQCINEIIRRHEVLRSTFVMLDERPVQQVASSLTLSMPLVDLQHLAEADREPYVEQWALSNAQTSFDLTVAPLMRATLFRLDPQHHILVLVLHHIVVDGQSMFILKTEMTKLYESFSAGRPSSLAELPAQYGDLSIRERNRLQGETLERLLSFWKNTLQSDLGVLNLPTDHPRPHCAKFSKALSTISQSQRLSSTPLRQSVVAKG